MERCYIKPHLPQENDISPAKVKSACAFFHVWDRGGPMSLSLVHTQSEDSHSWEG